VAIFRVEAMELRVESSEMIKAKAITGEGRRVAIFGLSHENLARLVADEPIRFDATEFGFPGDVVILAGKTEDDIAKQLEPLMGPSGTVR
jgi:hypothetical protein